MVDVVNPEKRSQMMSGIRSKNTKPELMIRKGLFALGFRYVINDKRLPGKPDIVLPKYKTVIMINGCFWHGHNCPLFKMPKTRTEFWKNKISGNIERDRKIRLQYKVLPWRQAIVWECAIRGKNSLGLTETITKLQEWIMSDSNRIEIRSPFND
jgi:DNA mismatch endonuclease, patch repair protein